MPVCVPYHTAVAHCAGGRCVSSTCLRSWLHTMDTIDQVGGAQCCPLRCFSSSSFSGSRADKVWFVHFKQGRCGRNFDPPWAVVVGSGFHYFLTAIPLPSLHFEPFAIFDVSPCRFVILCACFHSRYLGDDQECETAAAWPMAAAATVSFMVLDLGG